MILKKIIELWDWWIYNRAHHALRRMCHTEPAFAYLHWLWVRDWLAKSCLTDDVKQATELFYDTLQKYTEKKDSGS